MHCRSIEVGLVYVIWLAYKPLVVVLDSEGIKVSDSLTEKRTQVRRLACIILLQDVSGRAVPRISGLFDWNKVIIKQFHYFLHA